MAENNNSNEVSLAIELTSSGSSSITRAAGSSAATLSAAEEAVGSVKRIDLSDGGIRLVVTLPSLIDAEQANLTAALLLEQIDLLPEGARRVERVKISSLKVSSY